METGFVDIEIAKQGGKPPRFFNYGLLAALRKQPASTDGGSAPKPPEFIALVSGDDKKDDLMVVPANLRRRSGRSPP